MTWDRWSILSSRSPTKPDVHIREYEHNGVKIAIMPSALGLATIHDKDILIYCISQLVAKMNAGVELHKTLHLKAYDLLVSTNRNTDGRGYEQLKGALDRLSGTASAPTSRPGAGSHRRVRPDRRLEHIPFTFLNDLDSIRRCRKERSVFIYGHIDYIDVFDKPQTTKFCYQYFPVEVGIGHSLVVYDEHNEAS